MKITHTCTQCDAEIIYSEELHGKNIAEEIRTHDFLDRKVYLKSGNPRVCVSITVNSYQRYEELCRKCAITAIKKMAGSLI